MTVDKAIENLMADKVVGMPTETVYGLAARIDSDIALKKIFTTKKRPFFDPLIVHVSNLNQAKKLVKVFPESAELLTQAFWPGPLTLVLEKSELVSDLITAGLPRVGIRMPNHKVALELIEKMNIPLAAPSANKFGKTSPTKASHVMEEFKDEDLLVLDGGDCQIGVESTVLYLSQKENRVVELAVLRLGMLSEDDIVTVLKNNNFEVNIITELDANLAPGNMKHHYMPDTPLVIVEGVFDYDNSVELIQKKFASFDTSNKDFDFKIPKKFESFKKLELDNDPTLAARELYSKMRNLSDGSNDFLIFELSPIHLQKEFSPILEKIKKAASFYL